MKLNFNKVWASDTNPDYPTDTQAKRGLSFLGTEAPTFDLHDALFQRLDGKALWLYDQVRAACERFGQKVQNDDGTLISDARDTMANAITYALLNQRKADEGGYGIVRMANAEQTNAGQEYNLAVSPRHLADYVSAQNTWANTKDKPQTATRWPDYSEVKNTPLLGGSAYLNVDNGHWQTIAKGSEALLPAGTFASMRDALGTAAYHDIDPGDWSIVGNDKLAIASVAHIYGARNYFESTKVSRDNCIAAGFLGGDYQLPHIRAADGNSIILARKDNFDSSIQAINNGKVDRDNITTAGFSGGDVSKPYFKSSGGTDVGLARREYVDALNTNMDNAKITRDNVTIAGFVNGSKFDPYFRHSSGEAIPLTRLAYVEEIKKSLTDGKVDRDNITTAGFLNGLLSSPYMSGPAGQTLLQERATSGSTETNGTITFPNVITMQYGSYNYPDITTVGTFTIPFNEPWTRIMCVLITVDSGQDVTAVTLNVTSSNFQVRIREWYNGTFGGTIRWFALGFK